MTPEQLAAITSRYQKATKGEWSFDGEPHNIIVWSSEENRVCFMTSNGLAEENAAFIVGARTDIPALLSYIGELEQRLEKIGAVLDFSGQADAYHNLGGAIIDIERDDDWVCDSVCLGTLKRVENQLGDLREILAAHSPNNPDKERV